MQNCNFHLEKLSFFYELYNKIPTKSCIYPNYSSRVNYSGYIFIITLYVIESF